MSPAEPAGTPCWAPAGSGPHPPVQGRISADVAIVGAGLAGLATAYHLAEASPGLDIAVVDAHRPAAGASGRGTGLLGPRAGPPIDRAVRRWGPDAARRMHLASLRAVEQVLGLAARLGVRCGLRPGEQLVAARSPAGLLSLARQAETYRALRLDDVSVLSAAGIRGRADVPYSAGLLHPAAATLDPAALTAALAAACAARGVRLFGGSPLLAARTPGSADRSGPSDRAAPELAFPGGRLRAATAVLAVGAAAGALRLPVGTVLPLEVYAVATAPVPAAAYQALGGSTGLAVVDAVPLAPYYRTLPDGGLVAGGGTAVAPDGLGPRRLAAVRERAWRRLERWLRTLHPRLDAVPVAHRWSGRIGMTADGLPVVGPVPGHPRIWYLGGCCGHGLALSVAHGAHMARTLLGEAEAGAPLPWHRSQAPRLPAAALAAPLLRGCLSAAGAVARLA